MRLAVISGGSRGIGHALGVELEARGFELIEFSRSAPWPHSVATDFSSPALTWSSITARLQQADRGRLSELIVVSNAATLAPIGPTSTSTPELVCGNVSANLTSAVLFISAAIAQFQQAACRKVVANITAGVSQHGLAGWSLYCAAKAGMEAYVRTLALEQAGNADPFIPVSIDPGVVRTEMHVVASMADPKVFPAAPRFAERLASDHLASPAETAAAIARILMSPNLSPGLLYDARDAAAAA
ncbi:MAG TPA: SDR family NAD(P)-dependent oxidoreductase [Burkholderiaceae bacterium]|nr:SDR family NAD(P)-dependent oxidoreductase [Burkholderiaceae bacterium]